MRIKRVEIIGFKSFSDRAVVNIDADITGIVGPNGCGKSNIVDAIRWAMGEQSAKHLRGKAMEDVIFAGSESRGPAPMAEVSITFDDVGFSAQTLELAQHSDERDAEQQLDALVSDAEATGELESDAPKAAWTDAEGNPIASPQEEVAELLAERPPPEFSNYTEVTLTRRLNRDGLSQYYINKTPCRLRDITDFFLGTGVGTKAYAIIEQGRVGQIVSSRPMDRRAIIEEAAGITKFKAKKKAAEKKLDQTRQNLMRVSDIVAELDKRMGTLRRQAQKAERYRKYKTELRDIDLWKATHRWLELHAEHKLVQGNLIETRTGLEDARGAWTVKDAHVIAERAELGLEERRLLGVQEQVYELDNRLKLGESKIAFERREADDLDARATQARTEIDEIAAQRAAGAAELAERTAELAELADNAQRELADVATREAAVSDARTEVNATQQALDSARAELGSRRTEIATADTQLESLARRRDEAARRLERVMADTEQAHDRSKDLDREGKRVHHELATLRQTKLDLGSHAEAFELRRDALAGDVARGEAEVETLRTELHRRRSRLTSLQELQQRYEGFQRGTRLVMQQAARITDDAAQIRGLVADVVRAPEQLEVAVEAVLGDRLGGVLVDEPSIGVAAIGFLKQAGGGRSAFVPMHAFTVAAPEPEPVRFEGEGGSASWMSPAWNEGPAKILRGAIEVEDRTQLIAAMSARPASGEGVLGRMADLVGFADGYQDVGKRLLGGTVVVDGLDRALELHGQGVTDRLVTLDGDVVAEDGVVAGGSRDAQGAGVLAQKREIRDLDEIVGKLEHDLNEAMQRLVTAKTEHQQLVKALDALRTQAHQGELAIIGHEKDDTRVRGELERVRRQLDQLGHEQLELDGRLASIGTDEVAARERRRVADDRIAELERAQLELMSRVTDLRDRLDALVSQLTEARVRAAQLGEKRAAAEASTLRLANVDRELAVRGERLEHEIGDAVRRTGELRVGCDELALELAAQRETRMERVTELDAGRLAYEARLTALTEVELAARELRVTADALQKELGQLELRDGQLVMTRQVLEDGVAERHQEHVASLIHDFHQRAQVTEVEDARLTELKDLIERMGTDINLTAIEEFDEVSKRFEFLSAQRIDLDRAVDQLQRAIDKINKTSRKLFKDTFTAVNATFKEVFPRLFRGGQAALSLTATKGEDGAPVKDGDVDMLEAGIEIMAQPPGKKNSTVDQLSGGEKALTAVALVFSIFLIKPSPFCVLDEVDAPLDEANVDRYNQMVREMTDRSQFIVITHNKRTMEMADNLYGVTMQEPGVSKLVSVNLAKLGAKAS
ncbi:MAG TPA: chromosome segregation protein SMC [Kofleriaceae bacterium]|nr:chromosome segregation protein SMC [Kofleriaceae bacterium]